MPEFRQSTITFTIMGITSNFNISEVEKKCESFHNWFIEAQIKRLKKLGEECVIEAREKGDYRNRTSNLRSSIGYIIFVDGVAVVEDTFVQLPPERESKDTVYDGGEQGRLFAQSIGSTTKGVALVVVAGMNYAMYVEAKGKNVLASAQRYAQRELPRMVQELTNTIKNYNAGL